VRPRLFAALEDAFGVDFVPWMEDARVAAVMSLGDASPERLSGLGVPALALAGDGEERAVPIEILAHARVDRRVRGITVKERLAGPVPKPQLGGDEVLARAGGAPAWIRSGGDAPVHRVRAALPELGAGELLYGLLSRRPLATVGLMHFLRELTAQDGWTPPPLRASIVFDDPNLRWRRYGFIDYRRLVDHADRHGYHAAMAMIPLDAAWTHAPTVALFRGRPDRLSLVFHGNDHLKGELMGPATRDAALALLAQALRRVERFERRNRLGVDRVMMPPHGLAARSVTQALAAFGFDALCAIHPLPWTETPPADPPLAGWRPGEFVDGCAIVPRIPLSSSAADIALRAFLDHPIVLYGHHDDLSGGLDVLAEAAAVVNGLGDVRWMSSGAIATSNFALRVRGGTASVRPYARRVRLELADDVAEVRVEAPDATLDDTALRGWSLGSGTVRPFGDVARAGGGALELLLQARAAVDRTDVAMPPWRPWPRLRRAATEARDRALPLRSRARS
jgi:hypothetical protein